MIRRSLLLGVVVGLIFGSVNLLLTRFYPLADDTVAALLGFYGPMFLVWILASYREAGVTGRLRSGVAAGATVAFATFCVFVVLNLVRVNLFLDQLTARADWLQMMTRFRTAGSGSLRLFVNVDYVTGTPVKIAVATAIGAAMGVLGGSLVYLRRVRIA